VTHDGPSPLDHAQAELTAARWGPALAAFDAVLDAADDPAARFGRGIAAWWLDRPDEALRDWERAYVGFRRQGALDEAVIAAVYLALASSMSLGNRSAARGWTARAERLTQEHDLPAVRGWVGFCHAHLAIDDGQPAVGRQHALAALEAARAAGDIDLELCLVAEVGMALVELGAVDDGARLLDEAMAGVLGGEARDPDSVVLISCRSITASTRSGDARRAMEWVRAADAFHAEHASTHLYTTCRLEYGSLLFATGDWPRAEQELERARQAQHVEPTIYAAATGMLAEVRVAQGRLDDATRLVVGLDDFETAIPAIATVRLRRGDPAAAAALLRRRLRAIEQDTLQGSRLQELLNEAEVASRRPEAALAIGERLLQVGETGGHPALLARAHRALGRAELALAGGPRAVELLELAVAGFGQLGLPYDAALSRALLARAAAGVDRDLAIAEARTALATFEDLGALRDADGAAATLRDLGVRAAPRGARAVGTLTHREREVLALLGEGLSNPEIGDRLFITRKTVEHHVASILGKLALRSRTEAATFAVQAGSQDQPQK
jgi:DNA-binding CsgD family transcriptional regulator